jgi:large subunit ribosomal protein L1
MNVFLESVREARAKARPRKFSQTWSLSFGLRGVDLKKPENRFSAEFPLPEGRGRRIKSVVIADSLVAEARKHADFVVTRDELDGLAKDRKKLKKLAAEHDFFFGEAPLMPLIGKTLGVVLGPQGKMPKPVPANAKLEPFLAAFQKMVRITLKSSPVIHVTIGSDGMDEERVARNAQAAFLFIRDKLPKGKNNVKSVYVKLTMGPAVKVNTNQV